MWRGSRGLSPKMWYWKWCMEVRQCMWCMKTLGCKSFGGSRRYREAVQESATKILKEKMSFLFRGASTNLVFTIFLARVQLSFVWIMLCLVQPSPVEMSIFSQVFETSCKSLEALEWSIQCEQRASPRDAHNMHFGTFFEDQENKWVWSTFGGKGDCCYELRLVSSNVTIFTLAWKQFATGDSQSMTYDLIAQ